jgi:ABC-type sugar transport system substrate-binding protein
MKIRNLLIACLMGFAVLGAAGVARAADVRMFVRHEVADYGAWRKSYDAFAPTQKKLGVTYQAVYQSTDNPNDVTVIHDFHTLAKAKSFAASAELKAAMEKSGVKGAPQIWYTTKAAK